MSLPAPRTDVEAIRRFTQVVFEGLSGFADVRLLAEKGTPARRAQCRSLAVDANLADALARSSETAAEQGIACFVVPATTSARGRANATNVRETAVIVLDLDHGDIGGKRAHLAAHFAMPTLVVASGGRTDGGQPKLHLYWRLATAAAGPERERAVRLRATLARKVGGDPSVARLAQPIRVAGSVHCKHGHPSPVRIVEDAGRTYCLGVLEAAAKLMPSFGDNTEMGAGDTPKAAGPQAGTIRENGIDGITRFDALTRFIGQQLRLVRRRRKSRPEAWRSVVTFNAEQIVPSWPEARLRREFDTLEIVDHRNHPREFDGLPDVTWTEHELARHLVDQHGEEWRYVSGSGWLAWTGTHWQVDDTSRVVELCRGLCEWAAGDQPPSDRRRMLTDRTIRGVERLARTDPRVATGATGWDADPWLLNTPTGILDLRTCELMPSDPRHQMTRTTRARVGGSCHRWLAFVARVAGGDAEMIGYLQRIAGYCLTGSTREQAFFFLHGPGANGKTVFLEVLCDVLGSYARTAPLDTFMAARGDRHPIDLAALEGARLAVATETEAGRPWAEARLKAITGGDRIAVRRLYQNFYETTPGYKLLIAGNHRPRLTGGGAAMRRRLHLIPFDTVIPEPERDGRLREKLVEERDGILGWMLDGCRDWQRSGLRPPARVREAVERYFDAEDYVTQWIAERCERGVGFSATSAELFASWRTWAEALGLAVGDVRHLGERLRELGFESLRDRKARGWRAIRLLPVAQEEATR